ncbi:hypothetical protein V6N11_018050 [Hibiscus sabdariffa]|uniref:AIG1-type G domain-containing protein n=1 Tax=Hibiscus sabdariffa TaxID=183260 RepID=A0ABR2T688_9ROSI
MGSEVARTLVLAGRSGNGKSATGNSILRTQSFKSRASFSAVTRTWELRRAVLEDGLILNVIDTPGLFDSSVGSGVIANEFAKCIDLAKDGIHSVLVVFSLTNCFSEEEVAAFDKFCSLFGSKIVDHVIVVFTGGDRFADVDQTFEDHLLAECPQHLKDFLSRCGNRFLLFDNLTKDETKRVKQVEDLLTFVNMTCSTIRDQQQKDASQKGYTNEQVLQLKEQEETSHEEQLRRITEMLEAKLNVDTTRSDQQLAGRKADEEAEVAQEIPNDEFLKMLEEDIPVDKILMIPHLTNENVAANTAGTSMETHSDDHAELEQSSEPEGRVSEQWSCGLIHQQPLKHAGPFTSNDRSIQQPRRDNNPRGRELFKDGALSFRLQHIWSARSSYDVVCIAGPSQRGQYGRLHYMHGSMHASESREKAE